MMRTVFLAMTLLACVILLTDGAVAWDRTAPPTSEGPPWGSDRVQHIAISIGGEFPLPVFGLSGGSLASYAPHYSEGWKGTVGGFADLSFFLCPGHAIFVGGHRFTLESAGPETIGVETHEFGNMMGTSIYAGWSVHLPLNLESELWTCTKAPTVLGPVLYARLGAGVTLLEELNLTVTPAPPGGNPPWWKAHTAITG
ncbi:MAG: hypothetical protein ACYTFG_05690, partial [Planctomycetota bacterium]